MRMCHSSFVAVVLSLIAYPRPRFVATWVPLQLLIRLAVSPAAWAQQTRVEPAYELKAGTDRVDALYHVGELVTLEIRFRNNGKPVRKTEIEYFLSKDGLHISDGKVCVAMRIFRENGFFDASKHTNADWNRLLDEAVSPIMDARGKHIQVAYPVEWFNVYARGKGVELIANYDTLLHHHYTLMGLVKYNKVLWNRVLARVNFNDYLFRDRDGVAYLGSKSTTRKVADPEVVIVGDPCWGFCHEVGHVLQLRPQLTWGGMTEVSCNIFSMYTVTRMGHRSRLKAQNNLIED